MNEINYKDFSKVFEEDYSFIDDKSIWEGVLPDGSPEPPYEPSSDDGELDSDRSPIRPDASDARPQVDDSVNEERASGNIEELDQNELLEKVDEILM